MKEFNKVLFKQVGFVYLATIVIFLFVSLNPAKTYAGSLVVDYLIQIGKDCYASGNYIDALHEFNKVLLVDPYHKEALHYIKLIKGIKEAPPEKGRILGREEYMKQEIDNFKQANADLRANIERLSHVIDALKKTKEAILTKDKGLLQEITDLRERNMVLESKSTELSERIKELNAKLQTEAQGFSPEVQESIQRKKEFRDLNNTIKNLNKELLALKEENEVLKKKILLVTSVTPPPQPRPQFPTQPPLAKVPAELKPPAKSQPPIATEEAERLREEEARRVAFEEAEKKIAEEKKIVKLEVKPEIVEVVKPPEVIKPEVRPEAIPEIKPEVIRPPEVIPEIKPEEAKPKVEKPIIKELGIPIKAVINEQEFLLEHTGLFREGRLLVPLEDIAKKIGVLVIPWKDNKFKIIRPDGGAIDVEIDNKEIFLIDGVVMVTLDALDKLLNSRSYWDDAQRILYIKTAYTALDLQPFSIAKPKTGVPLREERVYIAPPPPWEKVSKRPFSAGELTITPTVRSYHPDIGKPFTDFEVDLKGLLYDYYLNGDFRWEAERGQGQGGERFQGGYLEASKPGQKWRFLDNFIDLMPLQSQYESFKGVKFIGSSKEYSPNTLFFGETESWFSGAEYEGNIFGLGKEIKRDSFKHKSMLIGTTNEAVDPALAGTTSYPRSNLVLFNDTTIYPLPDLSVSNQLGLCSYTPDNQKNKHIQDIDWRLSSLLEKNKLTLSSAYEFVGDKYASLGDPTTYQDIQRWDTYSRYKLRDDWSVTAGYAGSKDNVDDNPSLSTTLRHIFYSGTDFILPTRQSISLNWRQDAAETEDTSGDTTRSTDNSLMAIFHQPTRIFDLLGTYNRSWSDYGIATSNYATDTLGLNLYRPLPNGNINLGQRLSQTDYEAGSDKKSYLTNFGLSYRITPKWENSFASDYTTTKTESAAKKTSVLNLRYNTGYSLTRDIKTNFSYTRTKTDQFWDDNWSIFLIYSHPFDIVAPPRWGKIRGRVVQDLNNNRQADADEPGLAGVWVRLEDGSSAQTDKDGYYLIEKASPVSQRIFLDMGDLPKNLGPQGKTDKEIQVKTRGVLDIDFMAVELGAISGRLFVDANGNGDFDAGEEGIEGAVISVMPEGIYTRTLSDGTFRFDYAHPGKVNVGVDSMPDEYLLTSVDAWDLNLPVGGTLSEVNFFGRRRRMEEMPTLSGKPIIIQYEEKKGD